jgi:hypothetical protein
LGAERFEGLRIMPQVKYRSVNPNLVPRRTRLEVPGWAGQPEPRADGSHEYPWHCVPFSEAVRAGIELPWPYEDELRVITRNGQLWFDGDFGVNDERRPPLRDFGAEYYTYQTLIDLKVEPGFAIKVETHPRFYTDTTGTVPIAVPAVLRHWWPMINFVVFKAPTEGQTHVFRNGEPFIQITIIPAESSIDLAEMSDEEAAERELQSRRIYASRDTLAADSRWLSSTNTVFDGTYRRLSGAARSLAAKTGIVPAVRGTSKPPTE